MHHNEQKQTPRIPPVNTQLLGPMVEGFTIAEWCRSADGSGHPEAVAVVFNIRSVGDVVLRLRSRRAVDEMIDALRVHADNVFGPR